MFEFVRRDPVTYLPELALNRYEQKNKFLPPKSVNLRRGEPVWELISRAGLPSTIVRCPCTYPPDEIYGRMLAGVGVPDLRGGLGTPTFYSTAADVKPGESESVVKVELGRDQSISTYLIGPRNPRKRLDVQARITVRVDASSRRVTVESDGQPRVLEVREGEWSDWLRVKFRMGLLQSISGVVRFYLVRLEPELELYASPINFDPRSPMFPISSPPEYASELAEKLGTFYTTGMVEDHTGLNNGRISEDAYLAQCSDIMKQREAMMLYELDRMTSGLFYCLFDTPDRIQHMFWRFTEEDHPARPGSVTDRMREAIEASYRACDAAVGRALAYVDDDTLFMVVSDHGMSSFQRGFNVNTWLWENGLLALRDGMIPGESAGDLFRHVDWGRTRAYAVGLGGVYLNLAGRDAQGIVSAADTDTLRQAIQAGLTGLPDPSRGAKAIRSVVTREQVYSGPFTDEAPDLLINFAAGYRVSWGTPLGGVPAGLFEDNVSKWSGDHAIDPALVPGVLFMNRPVAAANPSLVDAAPTILAALGVPAGGAMEGRSLLL